MAEGRRGSKFSNGCKMLCLISEGWLGMQTHLAIDVRTGNAMFGFMPEQHSLAKQHQQEQQPAQPHQMIMPPCFHDCVRFFFWLERQVDVIP